MKRIAGVDEAGRGPLAGPVVAAAVVLNPDRAITGLDDSKKLSEKKRNLLEQEIKQHAEDWAIGTASVAEIDELNILHATMLAMQRAIKGLRKMPDLALIDGNRCPELDCESQFVIGGDALHAEISAASILAKQNRDALMKRLDLEYPGYGFEKHKGYPTKQHVEALQTLGVTDQHRVSFSPVKKCIEQCADHSVDT